VDAVLRRHSADSLLFALARRPIAGETWLDVGSGAGFPGLVLGIAFPETRFVLWEPQARRAGFLELLVLTLGLSVGVLRERLTADAAPQADVVVARALEDPQRALPLLPRLVVDGGAALVAAGQATPLPVNAVRIDVSRPHVDSPGVLLMMPPTR
jgi:16S rRNA (guanine527-N7)-methyltransferase